MAAAVTSTGARKKDAAGLRLDNNLRNEWNNTALHAACWRETRLDIVIALTRLSSWETVYWNKGP